jgi:hypothetical protein
VYEIQNVDVITRILKMKRNYYLNIIIFFKQNQVIPEYQIDRINFYLEKFLPPELRYTISYCNDYSLFSPSFVEENKYYCKGSIYSTGIILSPSNEENGYLLWQNLPGFYDSWTFYLNPDDCTYPGIYGTTMYGYPNNVFYPGTLGRSRFGFVAYYKSSILNFPAGSCTISWEATGDVARDIVFTYRRLINNAWSNWEYDLDAIGTHTEILTGENIQIAFMFNSTFWADTDSVRIISIG